MNHADIEFAKRELARRHYADYLAYAQDKSWKRTRMAEFLAAEVEKFIQTDTGHAYDILVINCPPQHGKSMTITESLPSWYLGKYPQNNVIIASYDSDFAERFCKKNKEKIKAVGQRLFNINIGSIDRASEFELDNGKGRLIARGIMSGITGNPGDLVIIDDPVKNQLEADSPTYRQRLWGEWQASIKTRLAANAKIIIIMTPWREDVFDMEVIRSEPNVRHIRLPVEAVENDALGREPGEALCPELGKDDRWLKEFKSSYISDPLGGQRAWAAMYMCSPRVQEGNLIKREWWKYYKPSDITAYGTSLISVDAAFKAEETSDFVSIQVWSKLGEDYYLRYCLNRHLDFPETVAAIQTTQQLYPEARMILIEEAANGAAIIQTLRQKLWIIPVTPQGGKIARVNAVAPAIESGHVYLPEADTAPWVDEYIEQWSTFPNAKHDDMVDSSTQALNRLLFASGEVIKQENPPAEEQTDFVDMLFMPYSN